MAPPARHAYVEHKAHEREEVQAEIKRVASDRNSFLKSKAPKPSSFDGGARHVGARRRSRPRTVIVERQSGAAGETSAVSISALSLRFARRWLRRLEVRLPAVLRLTLFVEIGDQRRGLARRDEPELTCRA